MSRRPAIPPAVLEARRRRWTPQIRRALTAVYPDHADVVDRMIAVAGDAAAARPARLAARDLAAEADPTWFQHESMVGYATYVDRFAGRLDRITEHLDHLTGLGVTYLHLMPFLQPRDGASDGGFAVTDYGRVDPRLGTMGDLAELTQQLHAADIRLCADLVLNHTAAEHTWATAALAGDPRYLDYYLTFPDRTVPDAYDQTLPEVFPDTAPGNFTWNDALGRWVWTTFNPWQWDLNWANPEVFAELLGVIIDLASHGVDILRLDAIPFLWKRLGTDCQNLGEVHLILQALRGLVAIAAPSVILKGEAIVAPAELVPYQGVGPRLSTECDLLYHNQLMVQGWSSLAAEDGRLATVSLQRMPQTPAHASWVTYVRCHDDIGWAIDDEAAAQRGWSGVGHRRFLSGYYAGELDYSTAEGANFQEDFVSGDRRTSGGTAALAGLVQARRSGDDGGVDTAIERILLLYALAASYGGIPLIWMGDEVGLADDLGFAADPAHAGDPGHAADNRWLHRPHMDWAAAGRRDEPGTVEGRLYWGLAAIMAARAATPVLRAGGTVWPSDHDNDHVLAFSRRHPRAGAMVGLANFAGTPQTVDATATGIVGLHQPVDALVLHGVSSGLGAAELQGDARVAVPARSMRWLCER